MKRAFFSKILTLFFDIEFCYDLRYSVTFQATLVLNNTGYCSISLLFDLPFHLLKQTTLSLEGS